MTNPKPAARSRATAPGAPRGRRTTAAAAAGAPYGADVYDLDVIEHEIAEAPFVFAACGQLFTTNSPQDRDWRETSSVNERSGGGTDFRPIMQLILEPDDYQRFLGLTLTVTQVQSVIMAWQRWHGIEIPESPASPRS